MRRASWPLRMALLGLVCLGGLGCASPPSGAPDSSAGGDQTARSSTATPGGERAIEIVRTFELEVSPDSRRVPLRLSYPTTGAALPVVVFSHGNFSSKDEYAPITDAWSARGYLVIAITHIDSTALGAVRGRPVPNAWAERLRDVSLVIERLGEIEARVPALRGRVDAARIAVAGHSFGGLVAQAFGGMRSLDPVTGSPLAPRAPAVRAVIALSGVGALPPLTSAEDFETLDRPALFAVGTEDMAMPQVAKSGYELRREPFELSPPGDKYLLVLEGADHYLGGLVGRNDLVRSVRSAEYLAGFLEATGAFLDAYLRGDDAARARLRTLTQAR